ncbi:pyruvate, water dikinase regulatory protein [Kangiella sp. TOML190]|uniref:posphoenolpyruvate synthetase regulatory kinase/phosphorylase PpsR n=1 Tax=Kangiella sp. TOML190 TaxID=2931351 RepID=UPI00203EB215|nr:pyruvate, water dikinase regulatory protein [Kangiella sp. TOML190]
MKRSVFFISDRTGITAEMLGHSLMAQFEDDVDFEYHTIPFVDDQEKANNAVTRINQTALRDGTKPIVFETIVRPEIRQIIRNAKAMLLDFFHTYIDPLEEELGVDSSFRVGKSHSTDDLQAYDTRMSAINFALNNDDGMTTQQYDKADIILVGASRCGKTPTSLYMAMQFGIFAANYPFTDEDIPNIKLNQGLAQNKQKIYGLTIDPMRLHEIRNERRPNSKYSSMPQCMLEVREVEALYRRENIPFINTTSRSVEELAVKIMADTEIERRIY